MPCGKYDGQYRLVAESEIMAAKCWDERLFIWVFKVWLPCIAWEGRSLMAESPLQESFYNYEYLLVCRTGVVPSLLVQKNNKWEEEILFEWQKAGSHIYNVFVLRCPSNRGRSARNNQHWYNIRSSAFIWTHFMCLQTHRPLWFQRNKKMKKYKI